MFRRPLFESGGHLGVEVVEILAQEALGARQQGVRVLAPDDFEDVEVAEPRLVQGEILGVGVAGGHGDGARGEVVRQQRRADPLGQAVVSDGAPVLSEVLGAVADEVPLLVKLDGVVDGGDGQRRLQLLLLGEKVQGDVVVGRVDPRHLVHGPGGDVRDVAALGRHFGHLPETLGPAVSRILLVSELLADGGNVVRAVGRHESRVAPGELVAAVGVVVARHEERRQRRFEFGGAQAELDGRYVQVVPLPHVILVHDVLRVGRTGESAFQDVDAHDAALADEPFVVGAVLGVRAVLQAVELADVVEIRGELLGDRLVVDHLAQRRGAQGGRTLAVMLDAVLTRQGERRVLGSPDLAQRGRRSGEGVGRGGLVGHGQ